MSHEETRDQVWARGPSDEAAAPVPGLVVVWSGGRALVSPLPLGAGPIQLGRGERGTALDDACLSRRHAEVTWDGQRWTARDLGSRNGSALDAVRFQGSVERADPRLLRVGDTLLLFTPDVARFAPDPSVLPADGAAIGPTLARAYRQLVRAARAGDTVHLVGETGTGKELAARRFHAEGPTPRGPFVAVNCAAIPAPLAERLLFGARKGAYSGADTESEGYCQAAQGGTLFLDEVAELDPSVQSKLLRVIESREVLPLGAAQPRPVDFRLCSATHRDLRSRVAEGLFREDLYFRIGRPEVALPPLRDRREDVPALVARALDGMLPAHASLIEACLLRDWPGNVRELLTAVGDAGAAALDAGDQAVEARHLAPAAGMRFDRAAATPAARARRPPDDRPTTAAIEAALRSEGGNVSRAARALGVHRTQLRRWLERDGIDPRRFG